jgi:hypothetical protein
VFPRLHIPLAIAAWVVGGGDPVPTISADARIVAPMHSIASLLSAYGKQLSATQPAPLNADTLPQDISRLVTLRSRLIAGGAADLFAHREFGVRLTRAADRPVAGAPRSALVGQFTQTSQAGSYNVVVTARGVLPGSGGRFVRKKLISVRVGARGGATR